MRRLVASVIAGLAVAAIGWLVSPSPYAAHPARCSWASGYGDFCVEWNAELGRYDPPPAGIPADFSRPDPVLDAPHDPWLPATFVFVGASSLAWLVLSALARLPRLIGHGPRPPGSDQATT
jgi:hypothetical protein